MLKAPKEKASKTRRQLNSKLQNNKTLKKKRKSRSLTKRIRKRIRKRRRNLTRLKPILSRIFELQRQSSS